MRLSDAISGCRAVHVDWPGWAGTGFGERADLAAEPARAEDPAHPDPAWLAAAAQDAGHARTSGPGRRARPGRRPGTAGSGRKRAVARHAASGRFAEITRVHYPGVELVCDARLSLRSDPYLAEYRIDGIPVLPAAMALEAMAQAASVLAGRPVRQASGVSMLAPVVVPAGQPEGLAVIRVCALRDGDTVRTAIRCADSGFVIDHFRATFGCLPDEAPATGLPAAPGEHAPGAAAPGAAGHDEAGAPEAGARDDPATHVGSAGIIDGTELYGPICFQSGRFRRVAFLPEVTPRSCRALLRGGDDQPWFGPAAAGDQAGTPFVLGSPGLNDATMHVLQACVPHRRLLPAGCDTVTFSGRETGGAVEIRAVAAGPAAGAPAETPAGAPGRAGAPGAPAGAPAAAAGAPAAAAGAQAEAPPRAAPPSPQPVPQPRPAGLPAAQSLAVPAEYRWDVDAVDAAGNLLVSWRGLRLQDAGPLPRAGAWPAPLLSVYLERSAAELGLGGGIRVSVQCGEATTPGAVQAPAGQRPSGALPVPVPAGALPVPVPAGALPVPVPAGGRAGPDPAAALAGPARAGDGGYLAGLALAVTGDRAVGSWHAADPAQAGPPPDPRLAGLRTELARRFGEPRATLNARLRAIAACLPPPDPRAPHLDRRRHGRRALGAAAGRRNRHRLHRGCGQRRAAAGRDSDRSRPRGRRLAGGRPDVPAPARAMERSHECAL